MSLPLITIDLIDIAKNGELLFRTTEKWKHHQNNMNFLFILISWFGYKELLTSACFTQLAISVKLDPLDFQRLLCRNSMSLEMTNRYKRVNIVKLYKLHFCRSKWEFQPSLSKH